MLTATQADIDRFFKYVEKLPGRLILPDGRETSACHVWTGARSRGRGNKKWYGSFRLGKTSVRAHRFSCEVIGKKECPPEHDRDHLCCFTLCVNDEHLEIVPKRVNHDRRMERRAMECKV
jgi:hypothetical protein